MTGAHESPPFSPLAVVLMLEMPLTLRRGREQNTYLSRMAREAARISARHLGIDDPTFPKTEDGVPLAERGFFWSVSHKPHAVAGIVHAHAVGIDIERIRPMADGMFDLIGYGAEWDMLAEIERFERFFRLWTAKEATLKAVSIGLKGLSRCRLESCSPDCLHLRVDHEMFSVYQERRMDHLVSVAIRATRPVFRWETIL
ncbi:MAG: 4'-phosphopantetheinyl transferase superfamily protein [Thermodesulfobacteriota bacterium]